VNALYPAGEMAASSIIRLASRENASDKFLEMIESTYKVRQACRLLLYYYYHYHWYCYY
jgi:hypothetical protein